MRVSIEDIAKQKLEGRKIVMLTAYDYPMALILDEAQVDMILVGDSLANVVLGLESTKEVGMCEMLHHARAVARAVQKAMVVGDMPFESYQVDPSKAVANAQLFMEAGCQAVKLEWFEGCVQVAAAIVKSGIPVVGHVGLTPQTAEQLGGMKVQGKDALRAREIIGNAKALQDAGCFSIVLECIPQEVAGLITHGLKIPTIGIGAGAACDGQVLVSYDLLGLFSRYQPKFTKKYCDLRPIITDAVKHFKDDVVAGSFPGSEQSFKMSKEELEKLI